jgi:hypothetical protein
MKYHNLVVLFFDQTELNSSELSLPVFYSLKVFVDGYSIFYYLHSKILYVLETKLAFQIILYFGRVVVLFINVAPVMMCLPP